MTTIEINRTPRGKGLRSKAAKRRKKALAPGYLAKPHKPKRDPAEVPW